MIPMPVSKLHVVVNKKKKNHTLFYVNSEWSDTATSVTVNDFTAPVGPTEYIPGDPGECFGLLFDDNIIDTIVTETNRYASQVLPPTKHWTTTAEEIRAYLGFAILMGINELPEIRDYWSRDPYLHYSPIADRISRDRFEEISRYLHFADNNKLPKRGESGYSRTQKVDPVLKSMKANCSKLLQPHRQISVDEAMIPFKGRSTLKQYMPKKPVKRGFKVWVVAEACSGYF